MTTETTQTATEAVAKTVLDDMPARTLCNSVDDATAFISRCQTDYADFDSYPVAFAGCTEDGEFDPAVYDDSMQVSIAKLTERGEGKNSSTIKAIVIYPSPRIDSILLTETGKAWAAAILAKELNHVAVRALRKADDADSFAAAIASIPTTIGEFTTSGRESTGGIAETYNDLWQIIKKAMGQKSKAFALANLSKKELRKAMESASYAAAMYPLLETRTNKKGDAESYFEVAATFGSLIAKQQGKDPAIFDKMLLTRDEKQIDVTGDDEDEFDLDAMAAALAPAVDAGIEAAPEPAAAE